MKTIFRRIACVMMLTLSTSAVPLVHAQPVEGEPVEEPRTIPLLTAGQLDELLGPIALYPDALIALILPAATMPADLVLASRFVGAGGDPATIDAQPWDESVRALARYADVVKWMDDKLSWSILVGDAFIAQPVDVMQSIQRLRTRAREAGTLVDSAEQNVVEDEGSIRIVPAQPEVIYVPVYDPQVVYVYRSSWASYGPAISYRWCYPTGIWLSYNLDWHSHRVWVVNTHHRHSWYSSGDWRRPSYKHRPHYYHGDRGRGWSPHPGRHRDHRGWDRGRPTHVVVNNDGRSVRPPGNGGGPVTSRPRTDGRRDRNDDASRDGRSGPRDSRAESPRVVSTPNPSTNPPSTVQEPRTRPATDGTSRRWTGRAANPGQPASTVRNDAPALAPNPSATPRRTPSVVRNPNPRPTPNSDVVQSRRSVSPGTNPGSPAPGRMHSNTPDRRERATTQSTQRVQAAEPARQAPPAAVTPPAASSAPESSARSRTSDSGSRKSGGEPRGAERRTRDR